MFHIKGYSVIDTVNRVFTPLIFVICIIILELTLLNGKYIIDKLYLYIYIYISGESILCRATTSKIDQNWDKAISILDDCDIIDRY